MKQSLLLTVFCAFFLAACGGVGQGRGETAVSDADTDALAGQITFIEIEQGNQFLTQYDLATGRTNRLFTAPDNAWISHTAVSPDGSQTIIAYAPEPPDGQVQFGYTGLFRLNNGEPEEILPRRQPDELLYNPVWSPDGSALYYSHVISDAEQAFTFTNQLERLQIETGEIELIAVDGIWPRLSPDGERLAFVTVNPASLANALYVADANGENGMQLISEDRFQVIDVPMFSPDGQWVYFAAAEVRSASQTWWEWLMGIQVAAAHNIPSDWWRIPADGSEPERLTTINEVGLYGEFAENGRFIIFASVSGLYRMQADGSGITQLLQTTAAPSFSWVQK